MFIVNSFKHVIVMVVYYPNTIQPFFYVRREEFVVVVKVYDVCSAGIETSIWAEFIGTGGFGIIGKFCKQ